MHFVLITNTCMHMHAIICNRLTTCVRYYFMYRSEIVTEITSLLSGNTVMPALRIKYLGLNSDLPAASCAEIYKNNENAQNGYYFIPDGNTRAFCRFDFQSSGQLQGWELLTSLDMKNPDTNCPSEFQMVEHASGVRYCRKSLDGNGCTSITYPHINRPITRLYGRVHGIQSGTPDIEENNFNRGIEGEYIDGISLTYGQSPRRHIWSFIGYTSAAFPNCPCSTNAARTTPAYIGDNYFCESGTMLPDNFFQTFVNDPIWDGQNCESTQNPGCCTRGDLGNGEWFYREFTVPFTPDIELRICTDDNISDEDIGLQLVELYFQ